MTGFIYAPAVMVSAIASAGLIQLEIGGFGCGLSPELAVDVAASLRRAAETIHSSVPDKPS